MVRRSILPIVPLILLAALATASAAFADVLPGTTTEVKPSVRVEALSHTVAPATTVPVPLTSTVLDTPWTTTGGVSGASVDFTEPMATVALAKAADRRAFIFDGLAFVNSIAGLGGPPSFTTWWLYQVNGWSPDVGAADLAVTTGDKVVFFECSSEAPWVNKQLDVRASPRGVRPGEPITLTVREDDLVKFNGMPAFDRWGPDPTGMTDEEIAAYIESIWDSPLSAGATLHVGSRVYELGAPDHDDGIITLTDLPRGTYSVWAEKAWDEEYNYVRSAETLIDVGPGASLKRIAVTPNPYSAGRVMRVSFLLSKKATVGMRIYNSRGERVAVVKARTLYAGTRVLKWDGRRSAPLTTRLTVRLKAVDTWGRVTLKSVTVPVVR
jgi:hypothetical protein